MDTDPLHLYTEEDRRLRLQAPVVACWSREGFAYRAKGVISKMDGRSVTVRLLENADGDGRYQRGALVRLPRFCDNTAWSTTNCVRPRKEPPTPMALLKALLPPAAI